VSDINLGLLCRFYRCRSIEGWHLFSFNQGKACCNRGNLFSGSGKRFSGSPCLLQDCIFLRELTGIFEFPVIMEAFFNGKSEFPLKTDSLWYGKFAFTVKNIRTAFHFIIHLIYFQ